MLLVDVCFLVSMKLTVHISNTVGSDILSTNLLANMFDSVNRYNSWGDLWTTGDPESSLTSLCRCCRQQTGHS